MTQRAPFGARRKKKFEVEDLPVVRNPNVELDSPPPALETTPTGGEVKPDASSVDPVHSFQRIPVKVVTPDTVEVDPLISLPTAARRPTPELPRIRGQNIGAEPITPYEPPEVAAPEIRDEEKFRGTIREWREAHRRPKEGERKVIRGQ